MTRMSKGEGRPNENAPGTIGSQGVRAFGTSSARVSLAGLLPSRARLRFAEQVHLQHLASWRQAARMALFPQGKAHRARLSTVPADFGNCGSVASGGRGIAIGGRRGPRVLGARG